MDDARLERMEKHLDEVRQAIVTLVRMEERMVTLFRRVDAYDAAHGDLAERVNILERNVGGNGQMLRFAERVFWIVVTASVSYAFTRGGIS
jgi:hypothetical protein